MPDIEAIRNGIVAALDTGITVGCVLVVIGIFVNLCTPRRRV
jgi:hypothetical protein